MTDSDPREQLKVVGGVPFAAPVVFDNVLPYYFRGIATMQWFLPLLVFADTASGFEVFERYVWDVEFFWGVSVEALSFLVWRDISC